MNGTNFLKDKIILISLSLFGVVSIEILLLAYQMEWGMRLYIGLMPLLLLMVALFIEYQRKANFYHDLQQKLEELDGKYLLPEIIRTPHFMEGKLLKETLQETGKSMLEHVNQYKYLQEDYKEYIELWIHEIKTPIAASKMVIENHKTGVMKSIEEELDKIADYTEQALFYARSNTVEKDYLIRKCSLQEIVNEAIKKNKNRLRQENAKMNLHDLDMTVNTDSKWMVFILSQILQNSCKYQKSNVDLEMEMFAKAGKESVIFELKDNGIGIPKGEVVRVFEKGFTGTNGRTANKKSTGIGLYLCKKLCDKLGMGIELDSVQGEGTQIRLVFPKGSYHDI